MSGNTIIYVVTKHIINENNPDENPKVIMDKNLVRVFFKFKSARKYFDKLEMVYQQGPITIYPTIRTLKYRLNMDGWYDCGSTTKDKQMFKDDFNSETWVHDDYILTFDDYECLFMQSRDTYNRIEDVISEYSQTLLMEFIF